MFNREISNLLPKIREFLTNSPVTSAWLFGSCSRGEETPESDIDILVKYDEEAHVTLFTIGGMIMDLSEILNRRVDLVDTRGLRPFAKESVEHDKILIYERTA